MADEKKLKNAQSVYKTLCDTLDARNWKYEKTPDELVVEFKVTGEDLPMDFLVAVDVERELIRLMSRMPFAFSAEKRFDGAIVTCHANYRMCDGSFDYDIESGRIFFRMTSSFRDSLISQELFNYMIDCSCAMVDYYNDKFLMVDKGILSVVDFFKLK